MATPTSVCLFLFFSDKNFYSKNCMILRWIIGDHLTPPTPLSSIKTNQIIKSTFDMKTYDSHLVFWGYI